MHGADHGDMSNSIDRITARDVVDMSSHWLATPENGYLGQSYGNDLKSVLQNPMAAGLADSQISKLRQDVPALQMAPPGAVNIWSEPTGVDTMTISLEVVGSMLALPSDGAQFDIDEGIGATVTPLDSLLSGISASLLKQFHSRLHAQMPSASYW